MNKVGVVILNYLNYKDTIECIDSLKDESYQNIEVIIVDNGSNNESFEKIKEHCKGLKNTYCLKSEENLGFAKGNNIGIEYAVNELNCDFVLVVNNDTIFEDKNLINNLVESYEEGVAVIGPRIIAANGLDQNPIKHIIDKQATERHLRECGEGKSFIKDSAFYRAVIKAKRVIAGRISREEEHNSKELVLHGACFMLTKDYFKYYPYLFPGTFLYYEENIITVLTKKVSLKKKLIDNAYIYHKEDQATEMSFNNDAGIRRKFYVDSAKECLKLYDLSYDEIIKEYFKK